MTKVAATGLLVLLLFVTGCGNSSNNSKQDSTAQKKFRIAVVLPSTVDDLSWAQPMFESLKKLQTAAGNDAVELSVSERLGRPIEAGAAIRHYAGQGYDIIFAHGAQFQSVVKEIAPEFPKVTFAYGAGYLTGPNIFAYDIEAQEGGYLLGLLAGKMTKTKIVGIVGPQEAGHGVKFNKGFQLGVKASNAGVTTRIAYTGSFTDVVKAGDIAKTHMDAGADILTGSSQQSVGAVKAVAGKPGNYWMSTDADQTYLAPDTILASQVYKWDQLVTKIVDLRKQGVIGGQHLTLSFKQGFLELRYNPKLVGKIPPDVLAIVKQAEKDITDGTLKIDVSK